MQVLVNTKFGKTFQMWYSAGKPDTYGNSNEPVVTHGEDGPYCHVFFW